MVWIHAPVIKSAEHNQLMVFATKTSFKHINNYILITYYSMYVLKIAC